MTADEATPVARPPTVGIKRVFFRHSYADEGISATAEHLPTSSQRRSAVGGLFNPLILALLLLAFGLRVHRIGEQRVWWDEGWSVWVARFSPLEILRQTGNDVHPPLYFELLHFWRGLNGDSEAALRLLSAFMGTLTIAMTFALGRRMARGTLPPFAATLVALLAALFLAVSRFAIAWSQEIRMYALASLLAVLAVWAARRCGGLRDGDSRRASDALPVRAGLGSDQCRLVMGVARGGQSPASVVALGGDTTACGGVVSALGLVCVGRLFEHGRGDTDSPD